MKTKQRGSGWSIALVYNLYRILGYRFIYLLMYPVTFFYFLFAGNVKESLQVYYKNIGKEFNNAVYFEHLRVFANCMVDRFISKLTNEEYKIEFSPDIDPKDILNKGCILLQSHYGGWAASANIGSKKVDNKINVVMQEALMDSIKSIEESKEFEDNINIIDLNKGGIAVSVEIANALRENEIVAIMGDRASNKKGELRLEFFNKEASFNKNPFQIAYKVDKPIIVYFIIFMGMKSYKIEYLQIDMDKTLDENRSIKKAMIQYIKKYEEVILNHPNQWFNFYNFWE